MMDLLGLAHGAAVVSEALVAGLWESAVLVGCVALCLRLLPGVSAAARSVVWTATMVLVCGLPFVHFAPKVGGLGASSQVPVAAWVSVVLAAAWLGLSTFRAGELIRSAVYLRGIWRRAVPVPDRSPALPRRREDGAPGLWRAALLCSSEEVDRPCVVGFLAPRVLIPAALLLELSADELRQIVLHELEHLRRGDDWTNLLQKLALVAFPLNPALLWVERQLCEERELACDDGVLQTTRAPKAYAACLVNLAERTLVRRGVSLALGAWGRRPELVRRVRRILCGGGAPMSRGRSAVALAALLVGVVAGGDLLAHCPQLVRFVPDAPLVTASAPAAEVVLPTAQTRDIEHPTAALVMAASAAPGRAKAERRGVAAREISFPEPQGRQEFDRQEEMVLLVTWGRSTQVSNRMETRIQMVQVQYAAVPTRNGWLFVQL
jgi:hypothetical protein